MYTLTELREAGHCSHALARQINAKHKLNTSTSQTSEAKNVAKEGSKNGRN